MYHNDRYGYNNAAFASYQTQTAGRVIYTKPCYQRSSTINPNLVSWASSVSPSGNPHLALQLLGNDSGTNISSLVSYGPTTVIIPSNNYMPNRPWH